FGARWRQSHRADRASAGPSPEADCPGPASSFAAWARSRKVKEPRRASAVARSFCEGRAGSADRVLQPLTGTEGSAGRSTDLDLLASAGIPPRTSLALAGFKAPETGDLHLVAGLQSFCDDPAV